MFTKAQLEDKIAACQRGETSAQELGEWLLGNVKKKSGRGRKRIDWEKLERLCAWQCSLKMCAAVIGVSEDTLEKSTQRKYRKSFSAWAEAKREPGRVSVLAKLYAMAMDGNITAIIWWTKNFAGMVDRAPSGPQEPVIFKIVRDAPGKPSDGETPANPESEGVAKATVQ